MPRRNIKTDVPKPRFELARPGYLTLVGRLFISAYDGAPVRLAALAKILRTDVTDLELRIYALERWIATFDVDGETYAFGRNVMSEDDARAIVTSCETRAA